MNTQHDLPLPLESESLPEQAPACRLSTVSALCVLLSAVLLFPTLLLAEVFDNSPLAMAVGVIALILFLAAPILAIAARLRIALSDGRLGGTRLADMVIMGTSIFMVIVGSAPISINTSTVYRVVCLSNLRAIDDALRVFASEHNDRLPSGDIWCDVLMAQDNTTARLFCCRATDAVEGESSYVLNRHAAGQALSELPPEMVLLFETQHDVDTPDRWNLVGGPERMALNHNKSTNVILVDGTPKIIYTGDIEQLCRLESLQWDIDNTPVTLADYVVIQEQLSQSPPFPIWTAVLTVCVLVTAGAGVVVSRAWRYPGVAAAMVVGGLLVGTGLGAWGEALYQPEFYKGIGLKGGAMLGLLTGLCYAGALMRLHVRLTRDASAKQLAVTLGLIAGALAAGLLHLALALTHGQYLLLILLGIPFGLLGGGLLGAVGGRILCKYYRTGAHYGS